MSELLKKKPLRNPNKSNNLLYVNEEELNESYPDGLPDAEDLEGAITLTSFGARGTVLTFDNEGSGELTSVNGAPVKEATRKLISYESLNDRNEAIGVKITIEEKEDETTYLDKFFEWLPYGIINKNRTGVGATTLEINAKRNSIIVVPTKNLASSKVLSGPKKDTGEFKCLYVGSKTDEVDFSQSSILEHILDVNIEYKKFIVVADSLHKVIEGIGDPAYTNYFLMLDEIDSYQYDSTFRKSMSDTLDYYFEFDEDKRCMVTATMQEFSNPELANEPVIDIEFTSPKKRDVTLIHTNNPNAITKERIEELYNSTEDKIVIAYNKVQYIMEVIENLGEKYMSDCAVLCSEMSRPYTKIGDVYLHKKLKGNMLPLRINFITCTYFSGIDINEPYHLISVANVEFQFTLLSPDRLKQIAGRGRKGLRSECVIYNTKEHAGTIKTEGRIKTPWGYRYFLLRYADAVKEYINAAGVIANKFKGLADKSFIRVQNDIEAKSKIHYYKGNRIDVVRRNKLTDEYEPAYFNIDALYEANKLRSLLYSSPEQLCKALSTTVNIMGGSCINEDRDSTEEQELNNKKVAKRFKDFDENTLFKLADKLRIKYESLELNDEYLKHIRKQETRKNQLFIDQISKLYKYVPFEELAIELLDMEGHKKAFRGYCNAVTFRALDENHVFKLDMKARFKENTKYTREEIKQKIDAVYAHHFDKQIHTDIHVQILGEFFKTRKPSQHKNEFIIESYNKFGFDLEPLMTISPDQNLRELNLIEFSDSTPKKEAKKKEEPNVINNGITNFANQEDLDLAEGLGKL